MNDKFAFEVKQAVPDIMAESSSWESALRGMSEDDYELMLMQLPANTARLKPAHFISTLFNRHWFRVMSR